MRPLVGDYAVFESYKLMLRLAQGLDPKRDFALSVPPKRLVQLVPSASLCEFCGSDGLILRPISEMAYSGTSGKRPINRRQELLRI